MFLQLLRPSLPCIVDKTGELLASPSASSLRPSVYQVAAGVAEPLAGLSRSSPFQSTSILSSRLAAVSRRCRLTILRHTLGRLLFPRLFLPTVAVFLFWSGL
jgi:hypothetical protein